MPSDSCRAGQAMISRPKTDLGNQMCLFYFHSLDPRMSGIKNSLYVKAHGLLSHLKNVMISAQGLRSTKKTLKFNHKTMEHFSPSLLPPTPPF